MSIFVKKGYTAAKISEIAAASGLSHGLVYHYFISKDEMFCELVGMAKESSGETIRLSVQKPGSA